MSLTKFFMAYVLVLLFYVSVVILKKTQKKPTHVKSTSLAEILSKEMLTIYFIRS